MFLGNPTKAPQPGCIPKTPRKELAKLQNGEKVTKQETENTKWHLQAMQEVSNGQRETVRHQDISCK